MGTDRSFTNYAIIGMGAAGLAAAQSIRQRDKTGSITILSNEPVMYYSRPGLAYLLAGEIPEKQLFPFSSGLFKELKLYALAKQVDRIDLENRNLSLHRSPSISYEKLLIATGARAQKPDIPGNNLEGVVTLDNLTDARQILNLSKRARTAVVIGGGITAIELVEGLVAQGVTAHYFLRGDRYWSSVLDEVESRIIERRLMRDGVHIHYHTDLVEITEAWGRVAGVKALEGGKEINFRCQMVAMAIGIKPRMDLAVEAGLHTRRGILVNPNLKTSNEQVFAAGDVAQVYDREQGEYLLDSLWNPAIEMGRVAGANMTGENLIYEKRHPINVTRLAGLVTTIIGRVGKSENSNGKGPQGDSDMVGIMRGDSETWRLQPNAVVAQTYAGDNRLRLYINGEKMVGAVVMGDQKLSHVIQYLIQNEVDISPIRAGILAENADIHTILTNYWSAQGYAAKIA